MTRLHTATALERMLATAPREPRVSVWDYGADFDLLWSMSEPQAGHAIVIWADTPPDPDSGPVHTEPHITPFDWAIVACSLKENFSVTVVDLRDHEHDSANYPAQTWLSTQRPECVPWLRRVSLMKLVEAATVEEIHALLLPGGAVAQGVRIVKARDALGLLPVCNIDLKHTASHHAIANLVGPLLLLRGPILKGASSHGQALRRILAVAGFIPKPDDASGRDLLPARSALLADIFPADLGEVRLVLCDDQWQHGWLSWVCERAGLTVDQPQARLARQRSADAPRQVASSGRISIWVTSSPKWLLDRMERQAGDGPPLMRRLRLTDDTKDHNEVLLLDLRLFAGDKKTEEEAFLARVRGLTPSETTEPSATGTALAGPADTVAGRLEDDLALLPRAIAKFDPLLPVVLFSSTGRRDIVDLARSPNLVTTFSKPRLLTDSSGNLRRHSEESFDKALEEAAYLMRRRRVVGELQAARSRLQPFESSERKYKYVGIYVDESGGSDRADQQFVLAAVLAAYPEKSTVAAFQEALSQFKWKKSCLKTPEKREERARQVQTIAGEMGVLLRGVAVWRTARLPRGPVFGKDASWADARLDRMYRLLLRQLTMAAFVYTIREDEVADGAECGILTDVRAMELTKLSLEQADVRAFGIKTIMQVPGFGEKTLSGFEAEGLPEDPNARYSFLDTPGVHPIVADFFSEDRRLKSKYIIAEARACKKLALDGHPLLELADHFARAIREARDSSDDDGPRELELWASQLLSPPGVLSECSEEVERLLGLARIAAEGDPERAVRDLVLSPDSCRDEGPQGLADRCRSCIADCLDQTAHLGVASQLQREGIRPSDIFEEGAWGASKESSSTSDLRRSRTIQDAGLVEKAAGSSVLLPATLGTSDAKTPSKPPNMVSQVNKSGEPKPLKQGDVYSGKVVPQTGRTSIASAQPNEPKEVVSTVEPGVASSKPTFSREPSAAEAPSTGPAGQAKRVRWVIDGLARGDAFPADVNRAVQNTGIKAQVQDVDGKFVLFVDSEEQNELCEHVAKEGLQLKARGKVRRHRIRRLDIGEDL